MSNEYDVQAFESEDLELTTAEAMSLPKATKTKVYATFRLFRWDVINKNRDQFLRDDVGEVWATIVGSDINLMHNRKIVLGTVIDAEIDDEGVLCVGAFKRSALKSAGITPEELPEKYTCSMEAMFKKVNARYVVGDRTMNYAEAVAAGIATGPIELDNPLKYDARQIVPAEYHHCALCYKGTEADRGATYLEVAATGSIEDAGKKESEEADSGASTVEKEKESTVGSETSEAEGAKSEEPEEHVGGANLVEELEKFKNEELPALLDEAKATARAEALAEVEAKLAEAKATAVEEYKQAEAIATARFSELDTIMAYKDEEKELALTEVRAMDELAFVQAKATRAIAALELANKEVAEVKATAANHQEAPPPTPRAEDKGKTVKKSIWTRPVED